MPYASLRDVAHAARQASVGNGPRGGRKKGVDTRPTALSNRECP